MCRANASSLSSRTSATSQSSPASCSTRVFWESHTHAATKHRRHLCPLHLGASPLGRLPRGLQRRREGYALALQPPHSTGVELTPNPSLSVLASWITRLWKTPEHPRNGRLTASQASRDRTLREPVGRSGELHNHAIAVACGGSPDLGRPKTPPVPSKRLEKPARTDCATLSPPRRPGTAPRSWTSP